MATKLAAGSSTTTETFATTPIMKIKTKLVNLVCASLLQEPRYYSTADQRRALMLESLKIVAKEDPEFVLKLALYVREDLYIRSTANFLVAFAASTESTRQFVPKYFDAVVKLPTDMMEIVDLCQTINPAEGGKRRVPVALRKCIAKKFARFSVYHLGKYNNERREKRKARAAAKKKAAAGAASGVPSHPTRRGRRAPRGVQETETNTTDLLVSKKITLKDLIREIHLSEPREAVMSILGKKYPKTAEEFAKSGLPGSFDASRAGKRMRVPVPKTWETLVSAKGNKAETWEELIDSKSLPFMAMLRNLRNVIEANVSLKHHQALLDRLTNEDQVSKSKQFPFRFLSAHEMIDSLQDALASNSDLPTELLNPETRKKAKQSTAHARVSAFAGRRGIRVARRVQKPKPAQRMTLADLTISAPPAAAAAEAPTSESSMETEEKAPAVPQRDPTLSVDLLTKYKDALDTAIKIATVNNVKPIRGRSVVFCDVSGSMSSPVSSAKGLGSIRSCQSVGLMLGLMIQYVCESCDFRIFASPGSGSDGRPDVEVKLEKDTILENYKLACAATSKLGGGTDFPYQYVKQLTDRKEHLDYFIILSDMMIAPHHDNIGIDVTKIISEYRQKVNPNLMFICVDLYGSGSSLVQVNDGDHHDNNILITGYSDSLLRFLVERKEAQVSYIESIDKEKLEAATAAASKAQDEAEA